MDQQLNVRQKINYQNKLDEILRNIVSDGKVPRLLLHSCCGPCSSYVVSYLRDYFGITVFYYNPNIYPEEEYRHRLSEQKRLLELFGIPLLDADYNHQEFLDVARGFESEPEGGARCEKCFELRLRKTREIAGARGFDYYCTTLTVSPHKNALIINRVGESLDDGTKPLWLPSDFKKREGYKKSIELSRLYDLYRQDYCGCEFAK